MYRATDGDELRPLSSTAVVRVRVLDVNDVAPVFTSRQYLVKAREDLPVGSVVGMVHAHDPDLYQGGEVRFSIVPDQSSYAGVNGMAAEDVFEVDEVSGTVRIRAALDYEQKQLFNLTIGASDLGSPSLSSAASFIVEVLDVNENLHAPRFSSYFFRTAVQENLPAGSHVAQVTAEDLDGDDTDDGRVSYSVRGGDGLGSFIVDEEGNIRTLTVLDAESKDHYWLTVHATDHGAVPLSSKLFVYVQVQDTNDNAPLTVDPIYFASVSESAKPFSRVATVEAEDADSERLTYAIVAGNPQSMFHVDPNTGILSTTKRLLDREAQSEHVLEVMVSDDGDPVSLNSTTQVVVAVEDVNDNVPEFLERYYKIDILEAVVDEDEAFLQNDQQNSDDLLNNASSAEAAAAIAAAAEAERESVDRQWEELFVNSTWDSFGAKFDFAKNEERMKPVFRTIAKDPDSGPNGVVTYKMKAGGAAEGKFQIDSRTGIVYAIGNVFAGEHYEMLTRASDNGDETGLSRVSVKVRAPAGGGRDGNRHKPEVGPPQKSTVLESDEVGHLVAVVAAEDKDGDRTFFSIVEGDDDHEFYMSPDKGSILLAKRLDWESKSEYDLTVEVTDGEHAVRTYVNVAVIRISEERPVFTQPEYEVGILESASVGTKILKV